MEIGITLDNKLVYNKEFDLKKGLYRTLNITALIVLTILLIKLNAANAVYAFTADNIYSDVTKAFIELGPAKETFKFLGPSPTLYGGAEQVEAFYQGLWRLFK